MSSDTGKDNASVVDSSLTEGKHDLGPSDDPESTSQKRNEDGCPSGSEEPGNFHAKFEGSSDNRNSGRYKTRYFIIKSLNYHNIQQSIEKGIWATQVMNEPILDEAFHSSGRVILIFSVNMSGSFQGYAQMISPIGWRRDNVWSQGSSRNNPWGRSFKVKWLQLSDLPFQKTLHLKNPLNDNKPVKISRDCQELPEDIGEALCELLDENCSDVNVPIGRDELPSKMMSYLDSPYSTREDYSGHPMNMPWAGMPMPYSSNLYQHQVEASRFNLESQGLAGSSSGKLVDSFVASKVATIKHSRQGANYPVKVDQDMSSRCDFWGFSSCSPLASSLTEDDFLEMSYEEYLEVHSKSRQLLHSAKGAPATPKEKPRNEYPDLRERSGAKPSHSRKRMHDSSHRR